MENQSKQTFDDAVNSNWMPFGEMAGVSFAPLVSQCRKAPYTVRGCCEGR